LHQKGRSGVVKKNEGLIKGSKGKGEYWYSFTSEKRRAIFRKGKESLVVSRGSPVKKTQKGEKKIYLSPRVGKKQSRKLWGV